MRRVLISAAIAASALAGLNGGSASAEPLDCNNPKYSRACETVNAILSTAPSGPGEIIDCSNPRFYRLCKTINDLIGTDG